MLPRKIDLSTGQMEAIDKCLERLHWEAETKCVLLADITGQLISERGLIGRMNTAVLSALAAGEMAATKEMASLVGEEARFRMVLHEGWRNSVYLSEVGEEMLLITIFNNNTPIGMVRLFTKEVVSELAGVIARVEPTANREGKDRVTDDFDGDFGALLLDELDDMEISLGESWEVEQEDEAGEGLSRCSLTASSRNCN